MGYSNLESEYSQFISEEDDGGGVGRKPAKKVKHMRELDAKVLEKIVAEIVKNPNGLIEAFAQSCYKKLINSPDYESDEDKYGEPQDKEITLVLNDDNHSPLFPYKSILFESVYKEELVKDITANLSKAITDNNIKKNDNLFKKCYEIIKSILDDFFDCKLYEIKVTEFKPAVKKLFKKEDGYIIYSIKKSNFFDTFIKCLKKEAKKDSWNLYLETSTFGFGAYLAPNMTNDLGNTIRMPVFGTERPKVKCPTIILRIKKGRTA